MSNASMPMTCDFRSNYSCWKESVSEFNRQWASLMIPVEVMIYLFMAVGLVGNILVLVIYSFRRQKTSANIFIMFLACIDLFTCVVLHPYIIFKIYHNFDQTWIETCKIFEYFIHFSLTLSSLTLLLVAFDRYLAICRPVKYLLFDKHVVKATATMSVAAVIISLPVLEFYGAAPSEVIEFQSNFTGFKCHYKVQYRNSPVLTAFGTFVMCGFLFQIVVMAILYKNVAVTAYRNRRRVAPLSKAHILAGIKPKNSDSGTNQSSRAAQSNGASNPTISSNTPLQNIFPLVGTSDHTERPDVASMFSSEPEVQVTNHSGVILPAAVNSSISLNKHNKTEIGNLSSRLKAAKILFLVTTVFFLSWMPFFVMRLCYMVDPNYWSNRSGKRYIIENLLNHVFYVNNAANPIIYTLINNNFRRDCKTFFTKYCRPLYALTNQR